MSLKVAKAAGSDPATIHYQVHGNGSANTTLGDTANNKPIPRTMYILNSGNLHILDDSNTWVVYTVTANTWFPFRAQAIGNLTTANVVCWA